MNTYVEEQRPDHLIKLSYENDRHYTFVEYVHVVTASDASNGFEWWFPYSNGLGYHVLILNATLRHGKNVNKSGEIRLCLQSPDEDRRNLIHSFSRFAGIERVNGDFVVPHGARGILVVVGAVKDDVFEVCYLVERRR